MHLVFFVIFVRHRQLTCSGELCLFEIQRGNVESKVFGSTSMGFLAVGGAESLLNFGDDVFFIECKEEI